MSNEPGSGSQAATKDCVVLATGAVNGTWGTQVCTLQRPYVCKRNRGEFV